MKPPLNLLRFFVYSNLFIAGCAILMADQTFSLFLQKGIEINYAGFVFFSTLTSYSFHWYLTDHSLIPSPRLTWLKKYRMVHGTLFIAGAAGSLYFFWVLRDHWFWLAGAALVTFLYSAPKIPHPWFRLLRKVALGKTIFLAFVWLYVTTLLPFIITGDKAGDAFILFSVNRFFLIYAICILFDYRDRADDKADGIRSLITYLDEKSIAVLFYGSVLIALASGAALAAFSFSTANTIILCIPVIITALLYRRATTDFSDLFYYLLLDGLMAFSAMLMLIAHI